MHVAVIGAGVVGVTTAHYLNQLGSDVTVYEKDECAGNGASKANGGQLSYSFSDSLADPNLLPKLPRILLNRDAAFKIRFTLDPDFFRWGIKFLSNCRTDKRNEHSTSLLKMALRSAELMEEFHEQFGKEYSVNRNGKLVLLGEAPSAETLRRVAAKQHLGCAIEILNRDEIVAQDPAIAHWQNPPDYAIFSQKDEVGDAWKFSNTLASRLMSDGVKFRFSKEVVRLNPGVKECLVESQSPAAKRSSSLCATDTIAYDAIVLCTGHGVPKLMQHIAPKLPIFPMTGYSVTLEQGLHPLSRSVTAMDARIVFSPIGDLVRIAGFADVNIHRKVHNKRIAQMLKQAERIAPFAAKYDTECTQPWVGIRPMTPNSLPIVGATSLPNVYTNLGHGMLGWTLSAVTAQSIARTIVG